MSTALGIGSKWCVLTFMHGLTTSRAIPDRAGRGDDSLPHELKVHLEGCCGSNLEEKAMNEDHIEGIAK
jgi:hypothetical protein